MIKLVCNFLIFLIFSLFLFASCNKEEEQNNQKSTITNHNISEDTSAYDYLVYEIGGEQERLGNILAKPYSQWDRSSGFRIQFHKENDLEYKYFIQDAGIIFSENYKLYWLGLYPVYHQVDGRNKVKEYKPYFCLQVEKQRYGKKITFDELKADLQILYNNEIMLSSNPIVAAFYTWHFYPYESTNRKELTKDIHLNLNEKDYISVFSQNIMVFDFYPENKTRIDSFVKYIEDKYYDKITKGIDFNNPSLPADQERYKVLYWPDPISVLSGKFKDE